MGERPTIGFRVSEGRKAELEEYVEAQPELDNLADLIRTALAHELSDDYGHLAQRAEAGETAIDGDRLGEVLSAVQDLHSRFDGFENTLSTVEENVRASGGVSDAALSAVFEALPANAAKAQTPAEIADSAGISEEEAAIAVAQLRQETGGMVKVMMGDDDSEPRYWNPEGSDF